MAAKHHFELGIARSRPQERKRVPQQGSTKGFERDGAKLALSILSINDDQFLKGLRTDPESTLWRHGFALSPQEMEIVRNSFADAENSDLNDEEIIKRLKGEGSEGLGHTRRWPF